MVGQTWAQACGADVVNHFKSVPARLIPPWEVVAKATETKVTIRDMGKDDELFDGHGDGDDGDDEADDEADRMGWSDNEGWWVYVTGYLRKVPWQ